MKKLELVVSEKTQGILADVQNHRVFGSVGCPEHGTVAIIAVPVDATLDVRCALETMATLMQKIVMAAEEPGHEN